MPEAQHRQSAGREKATLRIFQGIWGGRRNQWTVGKVWGGYGNAQQRVKKALKRMNGNSVRLYGLFQKIVTRKRGGYCFELQGLYGELLKGGGFQKDSFYGWVLCQKERGKQFHSGKRHISRIPKRQGTAKAKTYKPVRNRVYSKNIFRVRRISI